MKGFFDTRIEFLKGVGPAKAELLNKELQIFTFGDIIQHYPFRYEDRTKFYQIKEIDNSMNYVQLKGRISHIELIGHGRKKRLVANFTDGTGKIELVWFKGAQWMLEKIGVGIDYVVFGKPSIFNRKFNIPHPEIDPLNEANNNQAFLQPIYPSTEKLRTRYLDSKGISKLQKTLISEAGQHIKESLSRDILNHYKLIYKKDALENIHFPQSQNILLKAQYRLKFEEFFYLQLRLIKLKLTRKEKFKGQIFNSTNILTDFYHNHLPFELTDAQKKVIREIYKDLKSGKQMNRLIQGDVGSGKTIVSFICMLVVIGNRAQVALMAPTEILADQHYHGLKTFADELGLEIAILKGSSKKSERKVIAEKLENGSLQILIGTHALIEDAVQFKNLGLAIVDEQHRFGVAQRSKLWQKNKSFLPH
ncbi:MAG: DEAD/DEAH box helicase, partial [Cyclobacteriaceae bacterium]|nr:DEAD/DEAH box helicase [Cyclobacteriaceae bacterium]